MAGLAAYGFAATAQTEVSNHVVGEEPAEEQNGEDLETHPGESEVDANLTCARGGCGQRAAGSLEDKREDIAGDEDVVEKLWLEAG